MAAVSVGASPTSMRSLSANAGPLAGRQVAAGGQSSAPICSGRSCILAVRCELGAQQLEQVQEQKQDQEQTGAQVALKRSSTRRRSFVSATVASAVALAALIAGPAPRAEAARSGADVPLFGLKKGRGSPTSSPAVSSPPAVSAPSAPTTAPSTPAEVAVAPGQRPTTTATAAGEGLTKIQQAGVVVAADVAAVVLATATVQGLLTSPSK
ncbi:hypothetical protein CBR_g38193 [Chara braunii]|uniref:Uncharacterized protein n=1 Tax=Chara braunii TaxID=69332 RepID=A0A388LPL6_CHABU|nr:hypothetical protein CBR_g38193 [Chara braunii]|eukprot:GBG84221.1 hypothetical protein CBR_g38193 [Chara braunii]